MSCRTWKCAPEAIFGFVDIPKGPGCHLTDKVSVKAADINSIIKCFIHSQLVFVIFSSFLKLNETVVLPKLRKQPSKGFRGNTNIPGLRSNFVGCEFFLE